MSGGAVEQLRELLSSTPDGLSRLAEWKQQFRGRHEGVEGQLRSSVQSKLDEMHEAVQLLREAKGELEALRKNMEKIDVNCNEAKSKLSAEEFHEIRSLSNARVNIATVLTELDDYLEFPTKVEKLKNLLGNANTDDLEDMVSPHDLRTVFVQWFSLHTWKRSVFDQLSRNKAAEQNSYSQARILHVLGDQFVAIDNLGEQVWERICHRIRNCLSLAQYAPEQLVVAAELIVRAQQEIAKGGLNESECCISQQRFDQVLGEVIHDRLDSVLPQFADNSSDPVQAGKQIMDVTDTLLMDLSIVHEDVQRCFPPWVSVLEKFQKAYHSRLWQLAQVPLAHCLFLVEQQLSGEEATPSEDESKETVGALLLRWISWSEQYLRHVSTALGLDPSGFADVATMADNLMAAYIRQARPRMAAWAHNITRNRQNQPVQDGHGALVTTVPEDLFNMLSSDLEVVVQQALAPRHVVAFCCGCVFALLLEVQEQAQARLGPPAPSLEELCAAVNDSERIQEHCNGLARLCAAGDLAGADQRELSGALDELVGRFIRTATAALEVLAAQVMADLQAQVDQLFSPQWEEGEARPVAVVCATLGDYLDDRVRGLRVLIHSEYFFGKLVVGLFQRVVGAYVGELLRPPARPPPRHLPRAVAQLRSDRAQLEGFFAQHLEAMQFGGVRSRESLQSQLLVIELVAQFLESKTPQAFVERLTSEFGPYSSFAAERLVRMHHRGGQAAGPAVEAALAAQGRPVQGSSRFDAVAASVWRVGPLAEGDEVAEGGRRSLFSKIAKRMGKPGDRAKSRSGGSGTFARLGKLSVNTQKEDKGR